MLETRVGLTSGRPSFQSFDERTDIPIGFPSGCSIPFLVPPVLCCEKRDEGVVVVEEGGGRGNLCIGDIYR